MKCDYIGCKNKAKYISKPLWDVQGRKDEHGNPHFTTYVCEKHANQSTKDLSGRNLITGTVIWEVSTIK